MRNAILFLLLAVSGVFALEDITYANTYVDSQVLTHNNLNDDNDTTAAVNGRNIDTLELRFMRFADLTSGDTTLTRLQVDTIRSNPDIDSVRGNPLVDSINVGYLDADTVRGAPDIDSISLGYLSIDSIRGNPDVDSLSGNIIIDTVSTDSLASVGGITAATLNTGQGNNELYDMDQNVLEASAVVFATVNTGEGANELFDMNQNVTTTSDVVFDSLKTTVAMADSNTYVRRQSFVWTTFVNDSIADSSISTTTSLLRFDLTGADVLAEIDADGFPASASGWVAELTIMNVGTDSLTIKHNTTCSGPGYKIMCPNDADINLAQYEACKVIQDYFSGLWMVLDY